jgi:hypothetical protein
MSPDTRLSYLLYRCLLVTNSRHTSAAAPLTTLPPSSCQPYDMQKRLVAFSATNNSPTTNQTSTPPAPMPPRPNLLTRSLDIPIAVRHALDQTARPALMRPIRIVTNVGLVQFITANIPQPDIVHTIRYSPFSLPFSAQPPRSLQHPIYFADWISRCPHIEHLSRHFTTSLHLAPC